MPADFNSLLDQPQGQASGGSALLPGDKLLIDIGGLSVLTSLSIRTLRRMDSGRNIPGRVAIGRRVLFQTEIIREWVRAGLPGREQWEALRKRTNNC